MRLLAILLAFVCLGAAGIWAFAQFGDALTGSPLETAEPIVREPRPIPQPAVANPQVALRGAPLNAPAAAATPAPPPPAAAATPAPPPPAGAAPSEPAMAVEGAKPEAAAPAAKMMAEASKPASALSLDEPAAKTFAAPAPAPAPAEPLAKPAEVLATPAAAPVATATAEPTLVQQYRSRKVTYNRPPSTLVLDRPMDISLVINATDDADAGKKALEGFQGTVVERDVDLSDFVSAELAGTDFDIQLQTTSPRQKLSAKIPNQWRWRVKPTKTGEHVLTLTIYGYASGSLDAEPLDAYQDKIVVQVQELDKWITWAKSVQPLFAVLAAIAGATSALFAFLRFNNERKGKSKPSA